MAALLTELRFTGRTPQGSEKRIPGYTAVQIQYELRTQTFPKSLPDRIRLISHIPKLKNDTTLKVTNCCQKKMASGLLPDYFFGKVGL